MSKIIYIIPDFWANANNKNYQKLINAFESKNFKVVPISITWKYRVMTDNINEFFDQLIHKENDYVWIFWFSFGAMIAFISAVSLNPQILYLCSLSPYFREDLKFLKKSWKKQIGEKRIEDLNNYLFQNLVGKIKCKTIFLVWEKEPIELIKRVNIAYKNIKNSELHLIENARHDISQKEYLNKINQLIIY